MGLKGVKSFTVMLAQGLRTDIPAEALDARWLREYVGMDSGPIAAGRAVVQTATGADIVNHLPLQRAPIPRGAPFYRYGMETKITGATNATPIQLTLEAPVADLSIKTGDTVYVQEVLGNTAANGEWVVTVTGTNTLTLDDSAGNGAYTSGGWLGGPVATKANADLVSVAGTSSLLLLTVPGVLGVIVVDVCNGNGYNQAEYFGYQGYGNLVYQDQQTGLKVGGAITRKFPTGY
jgi:hypothetical protein